jgi:hypothetical protein
VAAGLVLAAASALASRPRRARLAALAGAAGLALLLLPARPPWTLLSASPLTRSPPSGTIVFSAVGRSSTVLLFARGDSYRLFTNGLPEAAIEVRGILPRCEVTRWQGMLPSLLRPEARRLLAVGLGGGSVLEAVPPSVTAIDVIELEPEVLAANRHIAAERAIDPLADPRVKVHLGDARGVLQLSAKRYDAVVSQPSHPWTAGASHLYTREFFERVLSHLEPGGVFVQWIGLDYVDEPLLRSLAATLVAVFGHVELFQLNGGPGLLFAASAQPLDSIAGARRALRAAPSDFARWGFQRIEDFAALRILDEAGTRAFAATAEPNNDDHNRLATRASRLGDASLDPREARALWKEHDPLLAGAPELDRFALIRRLVESSFPDRATALALTAKGALQETGLGWVELGLVRPGRAARHFSRALALDPGAGDAAAGLLASRAPEIAQGAALPGLSEANLDATLLALIDAWRHAAANAWDEVAALDAPLARIEPGEALFDEASRLRARGRLARHDPQAAAEAQAIVEVLLVRSWKPFDALLHARAALAAGRPLVAWGSLSQVAEVLPRHPRADLLVPPALEIAAALPEELRGELLPRLRVEPRRAGGR